MHIAGKSRIADRIKFLIEKELDQVVQSRELA
jgi:hypothetical protein